MATVGRIVKAVGPFRFRLDGHVDFDHLVGGLTDRAALATTSKFHKLPFSATAMLRSLAFVAALLPLAVHAQDEEEGRSVLLLYKKMEPMEGFAIGEPINVTLSVFNKGLGNAYSLVVNDDNWKSDKFRIVSGANNFTLDYLNAGDQCATHARKKTRAQ